MTSTYIGAPIRRKKDRRFLTGRVQFVDDVKRPNPRREELVYDAPNPPALIRRRNPEAAECTPASLCSRRPRR